MGDDKKGQKEAYKARKKEAKAAAKRAKARSAEPSSERAADVRGVSSSPDASSVKRAAPSGPLRRLVGQGIFQLVVKIIAGLIVAYILIRLGPR